MNEGHRERIRQLFSRKNLTVNALLMVLGWFLGQMWVVQYPGMLLIQALDESRTPGVAEETVLVTITSGEYEREFNGKSPLDPKRLSKAIDKIRKLRPRLLAIDLDTADSSFATSFRDKYVGETDIVLARNVVPSREGPKPGGFLGKDSEEYELAGIAAFQRDPDWTVRELHSCVELDGRTMQTFHRAIARAYYNGKPNRCATSRHPLSKYSVPLLTLEEAEQAADRLGKSGKSPMQDKIVILGGTYSNTDYHPSQTGFVPGVKLVADAVESQLASAKSATLARFQTFASVFFDVLLGFLVGWLYLLTWSPVRKLLTTLLLAGVTLFVPGLLLYWFGVTDSNPFIVVLGMLIGQLYESAELTGKREKEIGQLMEKIKQLEPAKVSNAVSAHG